MYIPEFTDEDCCQDTDMWNVLTIADQDVEQLGFKDADSCKMAKLH